MSDVTRRQAAAGEGTVVSTSTDTSTSRTDERSQEQERTWTPLANPARTRRS